MGTGAAVHCGRDPFARPIDIRESEGLLEAMRRLPALALCLVSPLPADEVIDLNPYIVVAPNLAPVMQSVGAPEIQQNKPVDLAAILAMEMPSIGLSRKSPLAGDIVLRGLSRDNVLITVDGNKTFCACPNRMDPPAFHVSSQQIEAVSVRPGPFSVRNGSTTGGAVLVRTASNPGEPYLRGHIYAGSFGYLAGGVEAATIPGDGGLRLQGGLYGQKGDVFEDGGGVPFTRLPGTNFQAERHTGQAFSVLDAEVKMSMDMGERSTASLSYAYQDARDVLYPGLRMDALEDVLHRGSVTLARELLHDWADTVSASLSFSRVDHDMRDSFRMSALMNPAFVERGYMMRTVSETAYTGLNLRARKQGQTHNLAYGLDLMERRWDANNTLMMSRNDMLPDVRMRSLGLWGVLEKDYREVRLEAGIRLDGVRSKAREDISFIQSYYPDARDEAEDLLLSGYALAEVPFGEHASVYGGLAHGRRPPDPQERFLNLNRPMARPDWIGNPGLDAVGNTEIQIGMQASRGFARMRASAFHAWLDGLVYLIRIDSAMTSATSYANIDARLYGLSADMSFDFGSGFSLRGALSWQEGRKSSRPLNATNDVLAEVPPLKAVLSAGWRGEKGSVQLLSQVIDRFDRVDPDLNEQIIGGSWTFHLRAAWSINERWRIGGGIDNLLDETYAVANSHLRDPFGNGVVVNEPGRFFYVRFSSQF